MDDYIKYRNKMKRKNNRDKKENKLFSRFLTKILLVIIITLGILIVLKNNSSLKTKFYKYVYDTHFSFATVNKLYEDTFGSPIPFKDLLNQKTSPVFNEKLYYNTANKYYDGVMLGVEKNLLVPVLESGMVIFIGEKDNYGSTVIIEQVDGIECWYGNVTNLNVKMYDYVEKGSILGNSLDDKLYLVYKKDGVSLDYQEFIKN